MLPLPPRSDRPVAITGVNVVAMTGPEVVPDRTVVVDGGRIVAVAPAGEIVIDGFRSVNGASRYLMPGLADMHVHWNHFRQLAMYLANGITTVRNMWGSPWHLAMGRAVDEGRFPGPRVVTTSPGFDGVLPGGGTIWPGSIAATSPDVVDRLVDEVAARGYHQIKSYELIDRDTLHAIGRAASRTGLAVVGHCPGTLSMEQAMDAGMTCFEHLQNLHVGRGPSQDELEALRPDRVARMRLLASQLDLDSVAPLAARMRDEQVWSCPTLTLWHGYRPSSVRHDHPLLRYEPPGMSASWSLEGRGAAGVDAEAYEAAMAAVCARWTEAVGILHQAGAPLLLGTDHGNPWVFAGFAVHDEIDNLTGAGLSPYEVLRLGTVDAARFVGEQGEWGQVTVGARGDLLLVDADPLTSPSTLRDPAAVITNGWVLERDDLRSLLDHHADYLSQPDDEPEDGHRVLSATFGGTPSGCCTYRHEPRGGEGYLIEEDERELTYRNTTRASLDSDGAIETLRSDRHRPPFAASTTVTRTPGGYRVVTEDVDGITTETTLAQDRLYPSQVSAGPVLPEGEVDLLVTDDVNVEVAQAVVTGTDGERTVEITHPAYAGTRNYTLDNEGHIVEISDQYLSWKRVWRAATTSSN